LQHFDIIQFSKCKTKTVVFAAIFIALTIILTHIFAIQTTFIRIDFGFLAIATFSMLFGPLWGAIAAAVADVVGCAIFSSGVFFPGFTLSAFTSGIIYGFFFYNKSISLTRVILASITILLCVDIAMNTLWLAILYHKAVSIFIAGRLIKCTVMFPIQVILIYSLHKRLFRHTFIFRSLK
jgi:ECF transporter S component (folate family)